MTYRVMEEDYLLGARDVIFIPAETPRQRYEGGESCDYISFNFLSDTPALPTLMKGGCHSEMILLISAIDKIQQKPHLKGRAQVAEILGVMLSILEDYVTAANLSVVTQQILDYLHAHVREKVTLKDIGALTFFSPVYCEAVFCREVGKPIIDYFIDLKIQEAQKLILEDSLSFRDIATTMGFEDYNYFSRVFKRRTGISPSIYRRQFRN